MTYDEFLAAAAKLTGWHIMYYGTMQPRIRRQRMPKGTLCSTLIECPLTAVAFNKTGKIYEANNYEEAGEALGLSHENIIRIVKEADSSEMDFAAALGVKV